MKARMYAAPSARSWTMLAISIRSASRTRSKSRMATRSMTTSTSKRSARNQTRRDQPSACTQCSTAARAKVVTYSITRMVARRMRRRFFGANRPTKAAMTTSAAPRMRMVEGDAYPSHCCARGLGAGEANGPCESICCETITAPAPAAAAAAAFVCCCWSWSWAACCGDGGEGADACAAALPCCAAAANPIERARRKLRRDIVIVLQAFRPAREIRIAAGEREPAAPSPAASLKSGRRRPARRSAGSRGGARRSPSSPRR